MINPKSFIFSLVFATSVFVPEMKASNLSDGQKFDLLHVCVGIIKNYLHDPRSYRRINSLGEYKTTGIIHYTATNGFGARIQQKAQCFHP